MPNKKKYVGNFRELKVYRKALLYRKSIYAIVSQLPEYEQYNLADMLRKCSCSIVSNLAEGNTNYYYNKEYSHLNIALSKVAETRSLLDIAKMAGYITTTTYRSADSQGEEILKMIIGMMKRIQHHLDLEGSNLVNKRDFNQLELNASDISEVRKKATKFNNQILNITRQYPFTEKNNMKDQIERASKSILNNFPVTKATSSPQLFLDLNTALASTSECLSFLDMGIMEGYITTNEYQALNDLGQELLDLLNNLLVQLNLNVNKEFVFNG